MGSCYWVPPFQHFRERTVFCVLLGNIHRSWLSSLTELFHSSMPIFLNFLYFSSIFAKPFQHGYLINYMWSTKCRSFLKCIRTQPRHPCQDVKPWIMGECHPINNFACLNTYQIIRAEVKEYSLFELYKISNH